MFFTDVRVPAENLVGEENKGWTCAKYLLTYERTNIAGVGFSVAALGAAEAVAARIRRRNGRPLADDPAFAARLARVEIELENMKTTNLRVIAAVAGGGVPGAESSMLKIRGTEIRQEISSLYAPRDGPVCAAVRRRCAGRRLRRSRRSGRPRRRPRRRSYFNNRKLSIFGGSNEIQRTSSPR